MGKPLRRNGRYSTRRRIPSDLIAAYGRKEIVVALNTADPAEGHRLNRLMWVQLDEEFAAKRAEIASSLDPAKAQNRQSAALRAAPMETRIAAAVARLRKDYATAAEQGEDALAGWALERRRDLDWHQAVLSGREPNEFSLEGHEVGRNALKAVLYGEGPAAFQSTGNLPDFAGAMSLRELVARWAAEREPTLKTKDKMFAVVREVESLHGPLTTAQLTPTVAQSYKDALEAAGRSKATGNNKLGLFRALCRTALKNRLIQSDPCVNINIRVPKKRGAQKTRIAFDVTALETIFSSRIYQDGYRPVGGKGEAAYWLPLMALYSGGRLRELGQLRLKDIIEERYLDDAGIESRAWTIRIVEDLADGLRLKNEGSERRIPLHSALIDLGFLRYVQRLRKAGHARLFPELKPDADGNVTAAWSKWFGRWLRKECGIVDKRLVFHSFRHTFKDAARFSRIDKEIHQELTGHEDGDTGSDYGGLTYPLHPLVQAVAQYRVPGFSPTVPPAAA